MTPDDDLRLLLAPPSGKEPQAERPADLHKKTPEHKPLTAPARRIQLPEPSWDRGYGSYVAAHPTHYRLRSDVRALAVKYLNRPKLRGKISINTYRDHPPGWGLDAVSFDVWAWGGRGHALSAELRKTAFWMIFNDPNPPYIRWCISGGGMWTPYGWQDAPWGPPGSDADHIYHCHFTFF